MQKVRIPANNWQPRPHQMGLWNYLENGGLRAIEIAHRRWGKDEIALNYAATQAIESPATYWHMLPEYSQARKAIWNAINPKSGIRRIDEAFPLEIRDSTNEQEMFIRFVTGSTWQVVGSDSYKSLVGSPPKGIIFSEWAKANPAAWAYLAPILEENGGWAVFITTPEGKNHAHAMFKMALKNPRWFAEVQTVEDTEFPLERVEEARKEYHALYGQEAGDALIDQEYYCSFEAAIIGAVYGKQMALATKEGRITNRVMHDPNYPVYTAWDLGYDDATAIWFYQVGAGEVLFIDYYEGFGHDVQQLCEILYGRKIIVENVNNETKQIDKWKFGDWLPEHEHRQHYNYHTTHYVPHDAGHKLQAAGGRSIVEQAKELGISMTIIPATSHTNCEQAVRKMLPKSWFAEDMCATGIESLRNYHYKYNDELKIFSKEPLHDGSSHGCDAAEIAARVHTTKDITINKLQIARQKADFISKRRKYNIDNDADPYRLKPMRRK